MPPDFSQAGHLPNLRSGRAPVDPRELPRQRRGITPQMHGRYPDFDVVEQVSHWDELTRDVVLGRIDHVPPRRFFTEPETATLTAFCDDVLAQDSEPRIPVLAFIDEKLYEGRLDGFQYADMPDDRDTWRLVLAGLDEIAETRYGQATFATAGPDTQEAIVGLLARAELAGGSWDQLNVKRAWSVCMRMILAAFYSHPWAWNEIGFGGPAYPRGYMRLGPTSTREPFERSGATDEDPGRVVPRLDG